MALKKTSKKKPTTSKAVSKKTTTKKSAVKKPTGKKLAAKKPARKKSVKKSPAKSTAKRNGKKTPVAQIIFTHDQIADRAFQIWLEKGKPHGQDTQTWHQAESELRLQQAD